MLKSLELNNFRNYDKFAINFERTTILIGPNGIGKTNIMEAIYLLSTARSWRTNRDNEVVKWNADVARIIAQTKNQENLALEMAIQKTPSTERPQIKFVKINQIKKKLTDLLGKMPTVLFSPEEILLVNGAPTLRRRFLDILLCQIDKKYTLALLDLAKIIKGRNKLLYFIKIGKSKINELEFWDEKLIILGTFIIKERQKAIENLNKNLSHIYQEIAGEGETLQIKYQMSADPEKFKDLLGANQDREIENTSTLFGPHRDDLIFLLADKDITTFGSRGEYRSVVLALKIAELSYLEKQIETKPILLLDDIFSELDKKRRLHLAKLVEAQQTIITTTDLDHIERGLREKAKIEELGRLG